MSGWLRLLGWLLAAWLAWYLLSCWVWPFRRCGMCDGAGRHSRKDRQVWRPCWWCKGSGSRLRYGRRAWNRWHRET